MKRWFSLAISTKICLFPLFPSQSRKTLLSLLKLMCREILLCFYGDFCMNLYFVDSDEAMKRGDEALNASSLQFLGYVKCFIATNFYSALNTSSPLLFTKNRLLMLHCRYFFKVTLPTSDLLKLKQCRVYTYLADNKNSLLFTVKRRGCRVSLTVYQRIWNTKKPRQRGVFVKKRVKFIIIARCAAFVC